MTFWSRIEPFFGDRVKNRFDVDALVLIAFVVHMRAIHTIEQIKNLCKPKKKPNSRQKYCPTMKKEKSNLINTHRNDYITFVRYQLIKQYAKPNVQAHMWLEPRSNVCVRA